MPVIDQFIVQFLPQVRVCSSQMRYAINDIDRQMKAVDLVPDAHIERRGGGAFFFVSAHMKLLVGAPVREAVYQPRIAVVVENDRLVRHAAFPLTTCGSVPLDHQQINLTLFLVSGLYSLSCPPEGVVMRRHAGGMGCGACGRGS